MAENRPLDALDKAKGSRILVTLKNGQEITGVLKAFDLHLNLWLEDAEQKGKERVTKYGTIVVRGDNILHASPE